MTPKKPTLNDARKAWLASLKPGDEVIVWSDDWRSQIWYRARVVEWADQSSIRLHDGVLGPSGQVAMVSRKSGFSTCAGSLESVIFPTTDATALRGVEVDQLRATIDATRWSDVPDSAVERIAAILQEAQS